MRRCSKTSAEMMRQVARSLLFPQQLLSCSAYATQPLNDYALTMKKASEISGQVVAPPLPKEIGLSAGIPMETYKRPVGLHQHS